MLELLGVDGVAVLHLTGLGGVALLRVGAFAEAVELLELENDFLGDAADGLGEVGFDLVPESVDAGHK